MKTDVFIVVSTLTSGDASVSSVEGYSFDERIAVMYMNKYGPHTRIDHIRASTPVDLEHEVDTHYRINIFTDDDLEIKSYRSDDNECELVITKRELIEYIAEYDTVYNAVIRGYASMMKLSAILPYLKEPSCLTECHKLITGKYLDSFAYWMNHTDETTISVNDCPIDLVRAINNDIPF